MMARPVPVYRHCPSCGAVRLKIVYTKVRGKARLRYYRCRVCRNRSKQINRGPIVLIGAKSIERKPHTDS